MAASSSGEIVAAAQGKTLELRRLQEMRCGPLSMRLESTPEYRPRCADYSGRQLNGPLSRMVIRGRGT